jgi:predicted ATPase
MQLTHFKITKYRNIQDSGWIALENLTAIVGKNESGKTALLKALHKFNPFAPEPYNMDREWPRGHRRERDPATIVCSARFTLTDEEKNALAELTDQKFSDDTITVTKNYAGQFEVAFPEGVFPDRLHPNDVDQICEALPEPHAQVGEAFSQAAQNCRAEAKRLAYEGRYSEFQSLAKTTKAQLQAAFTADNPQPQHQHENEFLASYEAALNAVRDRLTKEPSIHKKAHEYVIGLIPTFIYMSDYRAFTGTALLDQVKQRNDQKKPTAEDETLLMIMSLSGLNLDDEVTKGNSKDREQRQYDLDDASQSLTNLIEGRWKQRKYEIHFRADGQHFYTMVKDDQPGSGLIPLEERSKGFQWFFSFDLLFMHESDGTFKGCVILLDEPGLHLHPDAQSDLLGRMEAYALGNTLVYSTHLPFLLDLRQPERIRILTAGDDGTAYVTDDITLSKPEEKLTLQAALGMKGRQSYLVAQRNLVVEGADDFMIVSELSNLLIRSGSAGLPEDVYVTAGGGAPEAVYIATFMIGQELEVVALFDSDQAGRDAEEKLRKNWLTRYKGAKANTLLLGTAVGEAETHDFALEDLFPEDYYLKKVSEVYKKELAAAGGKKLTLKGSDLLCNRVARALHDAGVPKFNKASVAKRIKSDLVAMKSADEMPAGTKDKAELLIKAINGAFPK